MLIEVYIKGIVSQLWKEAGWKVLRMQGKNIRNYWKRDGKRLLFLRVIFSGSGGAKVAPIGSSNSRQYLRRGYWRGKSKYETTYKIKKTAWEGCL